MIKSLFMSDVSPVVTGEHFNTVAEKLSGYNNLSDSIVQEYAHSQKYDDLKVTQCTPDCLLLPTGQLE